ncbi:N-acetylglucosamine-6-phosphate deacetylase [Pseudomonas syringae]|uniref:Death on curing protein n=1 Tax=Pseudomonas syringae TaxID=317 RepID=A0AB37ZHE6_PSESX|nr:MULTISPECIES: type II toxin-antitoxin system death-on-curing family toxin [Pseudomonas]MBI6667171.1 type II toxin-antitoxin system death-on-curing family toxin [Pseudomonas syringae]MBI6675772.1 type II toxin-antitoxin system death-on-curing family toxin [Pseudomonas syringae]MBI6837213.1 type II toxin-antitoxin system death-on-curing family toxin [Pseudomonas syringae]NAP04714.1 type II toxin-antitoxin system death-on-curing family toxin [Pseudomonas syringae]NAP19643.1 type II toxin-antit
MPSMELSDLSEPLEGIRYLTPEALIWINKRLILAQTPSEPIAVIKPNELSSSQQRPAQHRYYTGNQDMYCLASLLMQSLVQNHPFANANKRTAAAAGYMFLLLNGYELTAPGDEFVQIMLGVANHEYTQEELEDWIAYWSRPFDANGLNAPSEFLAMFEMIGERPAC